MCMMACSINVALGKFWGSHDTKKSEIRRGVSKTQRWRAWLRYAVASTMNATVGTAAQVTRSPRPVPGLSPSCS